MSQHRKNLLSGTSTVVLMSLLGATAALADTTVTLPTRDGMTANITAAQPNLAVSPNSGVVTGTVTRASVTNDGTTTGTGSGTNTVSSNLIGASAADVTQLLEADLSKATTVATKGTSPSGIGILGVAPNAGQAVSAVTNSSILNTVSATNQTATQDGNTISATTALNQTTTYTAGNLPTTPAFSSTSNGTVGFNTANNALTATGGVVGASAQTNTAAAGVSGTQSPSSATLDSDTIALSITNGAGTTAGSLSTNALLAQYAGNSANNAISVMTPAGTGSNGAQQLNAPLVVANTQQDSSGNANDGLGAFVTNSDVTATATNATAGTLNVNANRIAASAVGNDASGSTTTKEGTTTPAGNAVLVADGISVTGVAAPGAQRNTITGGTGANPTAALVGDLGAFNAQQNTTAQSLNATATGDSVSATLGSLQGSSSTDRNSITAQGIGNRAANAITAGGATTNSIVAQAAIANLQTNADLALTATNSGNSVTADVATGGGFSPADGEPRVAFRVLAPLQEAADSLSGSTVTLSGNRIASSALGNTVDNAMALQASTLGNGVNTGVLSSNRAGDTAAAAGFTINSVQSSAGTVTALTNGATTDDGPTISLTAGNTNSPVSGATLTVDRNAQLATAAANDATSTMALAGSSIGGSAGVLGQQTSTATVAANLEGAGVSLSANGSSFDAATLNATNTVQQALGYANNAANSLTVAPGNGYTSAGSAAGSTVALGATPTVSAALSVLNDQRQTGAGAGEEELRPDVGATVSGIVSLSASGGDASNSTLTATGNLLNAEAHGNQAVNALDLSTVNGVVSQAAGANPAVAAIGNVQAVNGTAIEADTYSPRDGFVTVTAQNLAGSTLTASANTATAIARGNGADNALTVAGSSHLLDGGSASGGATAGGATAAFAVASAQSSTGGSRKADNGMYGVNATFGSADGSTVHADGNSLSADARDNTVANALTTAGSISSAAPAGRIPAVSALGNLQASNGVDVSASLDSSPGIVVTGQGALTGKTTLTASSNVQQATGYGNAAGNTLTASGSAFTLGGGGASGGATGAAAAAAFALNSQQNSAGGRRSAEVDGAPVTVAFGDANGSTVHADANTAASDARDNTVANALSTAGTVSFAATGGVPAVSALNNAQTSNGVEVSAQTIDGSGVSVTAGALTGATLTASSNVLSSSALGSAAANTLTAAGTTLSATGGTAFGSAGQAGGAAAAFALANTQSSTGGTRSALTTGSSVTVAFGGTGDGAGATDSTVTVNSNSFTASASDNTAANALAMNGGPAAAAAGSTATNAAGALQRASSVTATGALQNTQTSGAGVTAQVGASDAAIGVTVTPSGALSNTPLGVDATVFQATAQGNRGTNAVAVLADQVTAASNTAPGTQGARDQSVTTQTDDANLYYDAKQTAVSTTQGRPGITIPSGQGNDTAFAGTVAGSPATSRGFVGSAGDFALGNVQSVGGDLASTSYGQVSIAPQTGTALSLLTSPVSITNTAAGATSQGNVAANAMTLDVVSTGTGAPGLTVFSGQTGTSKTVASTSSLALSVPITTNTAVTGNSNVALASLNDATNTLGVQAGSSFGSAYGAQGGSAAGSLASASSTTDASVQQTPGFSQGPSAKPTYVNPNATATALQPTTTTTSAGGAGVADLALFNEQSATSGTLITASAVTTAGQNGANNVGLDASAVLTASNNTTLAQAQANGATNTISGTATNGFAASEALLNQQNSNSAVLAQSANTTADTPNVALASLTFTGAAVASSTADLIGNAAQAMARGNVATNSATGAAGNAATGNIAVASLQNNDGTVTANGGMALSYSLLGSGAATGTGAVNAATVNMTGNRSTALAMGNAASNTVAGTTGNTYGAAQLGNATADGGITGTTGSGYAGSAAPAAAANAAQAQYAAINLQNNSAAIRATNTSTMTSNVGGVSGALNGNVSGNSIAAASYANYATNTIDLSGGTTGSTTASLTSYQRNTGSVTSAVTNSTIGLTGGVAGTGTLGVNNNAISAAATGNSVTNVIGTMPMAR